MRAQQPRSRLILLSSVAAAHQVGLCNALQEYFDAQFWFYEQPDRTRGRWWCVDLGPHCRVLPDVIVPGWAPLDGRYWAPGLTKELARFDPDIVMLGGFSIPSNYAAYRWARRNGKKTIVFTERSRKPNGELRKNGPAWRIQGWLYRDVDLVMTSADDAVPQFRDEFGFGSRVVAGRYAADVEAYFRHPVRSKKVCYTYLFANRLTSIYDPLLALEVFERIHQRHPGSRLLMNAVGELEHDCRSWIARRGLGTAVEFLTGIKSWSELPAVYERADILLLPASFSNGNLTILEGMASGLGLVVSDRVLGIGRLVEDGRNGFNCEPTADAFVDRIECYIANPELFKTHAAINRDIVKPLAPEGTARHLARIIEERLA